MCEISQPEISHDVCCCGTYYYYFRIESVVYFNLLLREFRNNLSVPSNTYYNYSSTNIQKGNCKESILRICRLLMIFSKVVRDL